MITYEMVELAHNTDSNWLLVQQSMECGSIPAAESTARVTARRCGHNRFRIVWSVSRKSSLSALRTIYGKYLNREPRTSQAAKYSVVMNIYGEMG